MTKQKLRLEDLARAQEFYESRTSTRQKEECLNLALQQSKNEEARRLNIKYTELVKLHYVNNLIMAYQENLKRLETDRGN